MRFDVEKILIIGANSKKSSFFARLQEFGIVEIISKKNSLQRPTEIQQYIDALHILRQMVPVKQVISKDFRTAKVIAQQVIDLNSRLEHQKEKLRIIQIEKERVEPFGHFSVEELREIEKETKKKVQFFAIKATKADEYCQKSELIYLGTQAELAYFVAINQENTSYDGMIEILVDQSLTDLEIQYAESIKEIDEISVQLSVLAHHKKSLEKGLIEALNHHNLNDAKESTDSELDGELFTAEGWVPKNKLSKLFQLAEESDIYIDKVQPDVEDRVPTYLENRNLNRVGEDLIGIYDVPSNKDQDPSGWVFFSFIAFFSMIIADAGYGIILLAISLYCFHKFKKLGGLVRRVTLLAISLSIGCIIWGILTSSFLGIDVPIDSPLRSISIINKMVEKKTEYYIEKKPVGYKEVLKTFPQLEGVKNPKEFLRKGSKIKDKKLKNVVYDDFTGNVMIELAIFVGAIHIMLSFARYLLRNWAGLGWIVFMIGGYLYFPVVLKATSLIHYVFGIPYEAGGQVGIYLIFIGIGLATILAIIQNRVKGLAEIAQVIGVFADVMSYLRIYALSLAGMIMASTFNNIGTSMPFYLGIFVILAGHTINFTLALMGGLIHGLRLNFIEWYHYSFEGGGKNFSPLKLLNIRNE